MSGKGQQWPFLYGLEGEELSVFAKSMLHSWILSANVFVRSGTSIPEYFAVSISEATR